VEPTLLALHGARGAGKDTTYRFIEEWCRESSPALSAVRRAFADKMKWAYMRMWVPNCTMEWAIDFIDQWKNDLDATCGGIFADGDGILLDDSRLSKKQGIIGQELDDSPLYFIPPVNFRDHMNQFATESAREVYGDDHWVDQVLQTEPTARNPEGWKGNFLVPPRTPEEDPYSFAHYAVITDLRVENEVERVKELGGLCVKVQRQDAEDKERRYYEEQGTDPHLFATMLPDDVFDVILVNDDNDMDKSKKRTYEMMDVILEEGANYVRSVDGTCWRVR
jgi:hypothetical protein